MIRASILAAAFVLALPGAAAAQAVAISTVTLGYPSRGGGAEITQSQNGVSHSYRAELVPVRDSAGHVTGMGVVLREPNGPNLLAVTGEAMPRSRFEAVDCLGDPPAGGLYGREREFDIPGHDAHVVLALAACEATPDGENDSSEIVSMTVEMRVERGSRPRPP